jgi:hypothetical protein
MPRRARLTGAEPETVIDTPLTDRQAESYELLAELLANVGESDAVIRISRRGKAGGLEFCEQIPATPDFSEDTVKRDWGGGHYSIQFWGPNPDKPGQRKYIQSVTFHITGQPKEKQDEPDRPVGNGDHSLALHLARLEGLVEGLKSGGGAVARNPLDDLAKLTEVMRNLMPQNPAPGANPSEILSFAREAVGFAKEMAPEPAGESTPWDKLIEKGIEPAIDVIKEAMAQQKQIAGGATVVPAIEAGVTAPVPPPVTVAPGAPMWQAEVAKVMPRLIARAQKGTDPEAIAYLFLEDAPGGVVQELAKVAADPEFVPAALQVIEQYFPDVKPVHQWFHDFLTAVRDELLEEEAKPEPESKEAGNAVADGS